MTNGPPIVTGHSIEPPSFSGRPICVQKEEELDARLFGHIHFDHRLTGTTLEGDTFQRTTQYILKVLEFMLKNKHKMGISKDKWERIESALKQGQEEFTALTALEKTIHNNKKTVALISPEKIKSPYGYPIPRLSVAELNRDYIWPIADDVLNILKTKNTVMIPGGWTGTSGQSGHAMMYKLVKEADGSYTFMTFNTGAGIEYHLKKSLIRDKYSPLMAYKIPSSVKEHQLKSFLSELISPQIKPACDDVNNMGIEKEYSFDWKKERQYDEHKVYKQMIGPLLLLGAQPIDPEKYTRMTTQGQLAGTCSMRVLMPVLHVLMQGESEAFQQFLNQLRLQSIIDHFYIQKSKKNLSEPELQKSLLDAVSKEARFVERLMHRTIDGHPAISKELVDDLLKEIFPAIRKELTAKTKTEKDEKDVKDLKDTKDIKDIKDVKDSKEKTEFPIKDLGTTFKQDVSARPVVVGAVPKAYQVLSKKEMPVFSLKAYPSPLNFLKASYEICLYNASLGQPEAALVELEKWFFSLPIDLNSATEYWGKLSPKEAKEALNYLQFIQRSYGKTCADIGAYPIARQAIQGQTAKLTGGLIYRQLMNNPWICNRYDLSTNYPFPEDILATTLDPVYDERARILEKFRKDLIKVRQEETIKESAENEDAKVKLEKKGWGGQEFDLDFLKHVIDKSALNELDRWDSNFEALSSLDNARINLYKILMDSRLRIDLSDKLKNVISNYDNYLQYKQFNGECKLLFLSKARSGLRYFNKAALQGDELDLRANHRAIKLKLKDKSDPNVVMGDYETRHIFSHESVVTAEPGNSLTDFLQVKRPYLERLVFSGEKESNQRMLDALNNDNEHIKELEKIVAEQEKQTAEGQPPLKLPLKQLSFTRHLNDETRLFATLEMFESNLEILENEDCQKLLMFNFLTPNLLVDRIKKDPGFCKLLMSFYNQYFNYYTKESNLSSGGVFCFTLSHYLLRFLKKFPEKTDAKELFETISQLQTKNLKLVEYLGFYEKQGELSEKYKELLTIYFLNQSLDLPKVFPKEELNWLFKGILIKTLVSEQTENAILEYEKTSCLERMKSEMQKSFNILSKEEQEKLILGVLSGLMPDLITKKQKISIKYPLVEIERPGQIPVKVDLSRGVIIPRVGPLPLMVFEAFPMLSQSGVKQGFISEKAHTKIYEFNDEKNDIQYQLVVEYDDYKDAKLLMKPPPHRESKWYSSGKAPYFLGDNSIPDRFESSNNITSWTSTDVPQSYYYTETKTNKPLARLSLEPLYTGDKNAKMDLPYKFFELDEKGIETGYCLASKKTPEALELEQFFQRIEQQPPHKMIEIWQSSDPVNDEIPYKIKLPRYNLEWIAKKNKNQKIEYFWKENPDFRLIISDKEPMLGFPHAIYMENIKTQERHCIIPKQQFYVTGAKTKGGTFYQLNYDLPKASHYGLGDVALKDFEKRFKAEFPYTENRLPWEFVGTEQYCQYKILNNQLEGLRTTDYLQLAYIALGKHEPIEAMRALRAIEKIGGLKGSLKEVELIKRIMTGIPSPVVNEQYYKNSRIDDPETDAVRLYAAYLLVEQKRLSFNKPLDFSLPQAEPSQKPKTDLRKFRTGNEYLDEKIKEELAEFYAKGFNLDLEQAYSNYYQRIGNMDVALQLDSEKELAVLKVLTRNKPHSLEKHNRMQVLTTMHLNKELRDLNKSLQKFSTQDIKATNEQLKVLVAEKNKIEERIKQVKEALKEANIVQKRLQIYRETTIDLTPPQYLNYNSCKALISPFQKEAHDKQAYHLLKEGLDPKDLIGYFQSFYLMACKKDTELKNYVFKLLKTEGLQLQPMKEEMAYFYGLLHLLGYVYLFPDKGFESINTPLDNLAELCEHCQSLSKLSPKIVITEVSTQTTGVALEPSFNRVSTPSVVTTFASSSVVKSEWMSLEKSKTPALLLGRELEETTLLQETDTLSKQLKEQLKKSEAAFKNIKEVAEEDKFLAKQKRKIELELVVGKQLNENRVAQNKIYHQHLNDPAKQHKMQEALRKHMQADQLELNKLEKEIVTLSQVAITGEKASSETELRVLGKKQVIMPSAKDKAELPKIPGLSSDLVWLYLQGDAELFREKTQLNITDANKLYQNIHHYFLKFSEYQQRLRTVQTLDNLDKCKDKNTVEYHGFIEQLGDQLVNSRCFDAETNPEMLVFECLDNKLIREDQGKTLHRLTEKTITDKGDVSYRNEIEQKIMGAGKTILLMPLLALKKATGRNLSILVLPSALFETNVADINALTKRLFGKTGYPLIFNRDSDCSLSNLQAMYEKLKEVMVNRDYVMTTAESVESLQLKYIELLDKESLSLDEEKVILEIEKILILIQEYGDALIDECDTTLDPKKELNYTRGQKQNVSPDLFKNILKIYSLLDTVKLGRGLETYTLKQVMMGQKGIPTELEWDLALQTLAKNLIENNEGLLHAFGQSLDPREKEILIQYLLNEKLTEIPKFVTESPHKGLVALVKGEIELFRSCLKNKFNEHYGFPTSAEFEESKEVAIPYISNNTPNERAQFGSVYEIINYTIEAQKQKGLLSPHLIYQFIAHFQTEAAYEVMGSLGKTNIALTKAALEFEKLTGRKVNSIDLNNKTELIKLQKEFTENDKTNDYILEKHVLPNIKQYGSVLRANSINHVEQYRSAQGFSGTPWNVHCYHQRFNFNEEDSLGVDGKTLDILLEKNPPIRKCSMPNSETIILEAVINHPETHNIHAFIDIGALFKKPNETIAHEFSNLLARRPHNNVQHVLYFNENNVLCALPVRRTSKETSKEKMEEKEDKIKPIIIGSTNPDVIYEKIGSRPEQCFTYYDQFHTTGTDIKQKSNAIGIASIDSNTKIRDVTQGIMRLRDLPKGQRLELLASNAVFSTKEKNATWKPQDIIDLTQKNQDHALADLHLRSHLDKMNNIIRKKMLDRIVKCDNVALKANLRKKFAKVFDVSLAADPFHEFKDLEVLTRTEKILQVQKNLCLTNYKELVASANIAFDELEYKQIEKLLQDIYEKGIVFCKNAYRQSTNLNQGRMVEAQREKQKETRKETKKEKRSEKYTQHMVEKAKANISPYKGWEGVFPPVLQKEDVNINPKKNIKIQTLNDMINTSSEVRWTFEENLFVSENYYNTYQEQTNNMDDFQKPLNFFLLVQEPDGKLKAMLITQEEAREFSESIDKNKSEMKKNGREAWILTPKNHCLKGTSEGLKHKDYPKILEQIQFFNGDLDKLIEEKAMDWLFVDAAEKQIFLENTILSNFPEKNKFLRNFKETLDKTTQELLIFVAKVNKTGLKEAIVAQDLKAFLEALQHFKINLNSIGNKGICTQVLSQPLPGGENSFLELAIQTKSFAIVEAMLKEQDLMPKLSFNENSHPLLQALANYQKDIFNLIALDKRMYPQADNLLGWEGVFKKVMQSDKKDAIVIFLEQAKKHCNPNLFVRIINDHFNRALLSNDVVKTLSVLEKYYNLPNYNNNIWEDFVSSIQDGLLAENATRERLIKLLMEWKEKPPNSVIKSYLQNKFSYKPKSLLYDLFTRSSEIFFVFFNDKAFALVPQDHDSWIELIRQSYRRSSDVETHKKVLEAINRNLKILSETEKNVLLNNPMLSEILTELLGAAQGYSGTIDKLLSFMEIYPDYQKTGAWMAITNSFEKNKTLYTSLKMREKMVGAFHAILQKISENEKTKVEENDMKEKFEILNKISLVFLECGTIESFYQLIKDIDFTSPAYIAWGNSLLKRCINLKQWDNVQFLLQKGIVLQDNDVKEQIFEWAAIHQKYETVKYLLKINVSPNTKTSFQEKVENAYSWSGQEKIQWVTRPALFWAIENQDLELMKILITAGAEIVQPKDPYSYDSYKTKDALDKILDIRPKEKIITLFKTLPEDSLKRFKDNSEILKRIFVWANSDRGGYEKIDEDQLKILDWIMSLVTPEKLLNKNGPYFTHLKNTIEHVLYNKKWAWLKVYLKAFGDKNAEQFNDSFKSLDEYALEAVKKNRIESVKVLFELGGVVNDSYLQLDKVAIYTAACESNALELVQILFKNKKQKIDLLMAKPELLSWAIKNNKTNLVNLLLLEYSQNKYSIRNWHQVENDVLKTAIEVHNLQAVSGGNNLPMIYRLINDFQMEPAAGFILDAIKSGDIELLSCLLKTTHDKTKALRYIVEYQFRQLEHPKPKAPATTFKKEEEFDIDTDAVTFIDVPAPTEEENIMDVIDWLNKQGIGSVEILEKAVKCDLMGTAKKMLENKQLLEELSPRKNDLLKKALESNSIYARFLVENLAAGDEACFLLALRKQPSLVEALLKNCPSLDVNIKENDGTSPLQIAIEKGDSALLSVLLDFGFSAEETIMIRQALPTIPEIPPLPDISDLSDVLQFPSGVPTIPSIPEPSTYKEPESSATSYDDFDPFEDKPNLPPPIPARGARRFVSDSDEYFDDAATKTTKEDIEKEKAEQKPVEEYKTLLILAVELGDMKMVKALVENDATLTATNSNNETAIMVANRLAASSTAAAEAPPAPSMLPDPFALDEEDKSLGPTKTQKQTIAVQIADYLNAEHKKQLASDVKATAEDKGKKSKAKKPALLFSKPAKSAATTASTIDTPSALPTPASSPQTPTSSSTTSTSSTPTPASQEPSKTGTTKTPTSTPAPKPDDTPKPDKF